MRLAQKKNTYTEYKTRDGKNLGAGGNREMREKSTNSNVIALTLVNNADGSGNVDGKNYTCSVRLIGLLLFHSKSVV